MSIWRKCLLGTDKSVSCISCGRSVGVPFGAVLAAAPIALGIAGLVKLSMPWSIASLVGGLMTYFVLQLYVVPVVGRET